MAYIARTPAEVIAGEAVSGSPEARWNDMVAIASVAANRAAMLGVSLDDVMGVQSQFNAYGKPLPAGAQNYVNTAQQALDYVAANGPVNNATFYATPSAVGNLPGGLVQEGATTGHMYFSDPAMRSIRTAVGDIRPDPNALPSTANMDPLQKAINAPYEANGLLNGVTSLTNAPATAVTSTSTHAQSLDPAFQPNGLLSGNFPTSSFTATPAQNNFADLAAAGPMGGDFATVAERMGLPGGQTNLASADPSTATPSSVTNRMGGVLSGFRDLASAPPVQSPLGVTASLAQMQQPNLAAQASVPMTTGFFSPNVSQVPDIASTTQTPSQMGILATGDNTLGAKQPTLNNLSSLAAAGPLSAPIASPMNSPANGVTNVASGQFDPSRFAAPGAMDSVMQTPSYLGVPAAQPTLDNWSAVAAANPVQTPLNSTAVLGQMQQPNLAAQASVPLSAGVFSPPQQTVSTPSLNNWSDLASAGPIQAPETSGINSPEAQQIRAQAEQNLKDMQAARIASVAPTGVLGTTPGLEASAVAKPTVTANATGLLGTPPDLSASAVATPTLSVSPGLLSSTQLSASSPQLSTASVPGAGLLSSSITPNYQQYQSFVPSDVQPVSTPTQVANTTVQAPAISEDLGATYSTVTKPDYQSLVAASFPSTVQAPSLNIAQDPAVSVPSLQTVSIPDQPTVATPTDVTTSTPGVTVQGPATTPVSQQQTTAKAPTQSKSIFNGGMLTGGLLGAVAAGPFGAALGGLLGGEISKNGGIKGLLSGSPSHINNIGGGLQNVASVYGGAPVGTQANTNNGGFVTALQGGSVAYTNPFGVTTVFGPNQTTASWFGGNLTGSSMDGISTQAGHNDPDGSHGGYGGGGGFGAGLF